MTPLRSGVPSLIYFMSCDIKETISNVSIEENIFSMEGIEFGVKLLTTRRTKDTEDYQVETFKIEGHILFTNIHDLLNLVVKNSFPEPWTWSLIVAIFKSGDRIIPSNYRIIKINLILAKI